MQHRNDTCRKHYLFTDTDRKKKLCPEGYPAFSRRNRAVFVFLKRFFIANILRIVVGAAGIVVGSQLLVNNGSRIAAFFGVSEAVIGVTIVAVGTSLPELVTAITAIVKKQSSMSVGNVIGANVIDTTLILAVCSFVYGGKLPVSAQNIYLDFPVAIIVSLIAVVPTVIRRKFSRVQGVVMLAVYILYLVIVVGGLGRYLSFFGISA